MTGSEFKKRRERLGKTQAELAREMGVDKRTILRWEGDQVAIPRTVELALREIERREGRSGHR